MKIRWVLDLLAENESIAFGDLFGSGTRRIEMVVTFMALMEQMRQKQIKALQDEVFGPISIFLGAGFTLKSQEGDLATHGI